MIPEREIAPRIARALDPLEKGILWVVAYASIFGAPVRKSRLWTRIVGVSATESEMRSALSGATLRSLLVEDDDLVWLRGSREPDAPGAFLRRETATRDLLHRHGDILAFLRGLSGMRLAALSGGCAHDAADDGDIDVFVVTARDALWRTLLLATLVSKARGWRSILCLNYLVDETAQALPGRDFYGAFELISLKPLANEEAFLDLLLANAWAEPIFPNFFRSRLQGQNPASRIPAKSGGRQFEAAARMIQRSYLRHRLPNGPGVELSDHVVRLHTTDHRPRLRNLFLHALEKIGMDEPPWI